MKMMTAFCASLFALTAASSVHAITMVHIAGSTTYAGSANAAILKSFDTGTSVRVGTTHSDFTRSLVTFFRGTMGSTTTIIETNFSGSVAGIKAVTLGETLEFFDDNLYLVTGTTRGITVSSNPTIPSFSVGAGLNDIPSGLNVVVPEVVLSDVWQSGTLYKTPTLTGAAITGQAAGTVGVIPYVWIRTPSASSAVNGLWNMNHNFLGMLYGNGTLPLALWSNNSADETKLVYAAGRNPFSGSRLAAFAEGQVGANSTVVQYHPLSQNSTPVTGLSQTGSITAVELWPDTTIASPAGSFVYGNGGEASGQALSAYMSKVFNIGTAGAMVAFCGTRDASEAIQKGAVPLCWSGVSLVSSYALGSLPTYNYDLIRNGKYTFWAYEHMYYPSGTATDRKTVANKIATQLYNVDAQILMSSMRVSRPVEGGIVGPRY